MSWFLFSLICMFGWGCADLFYKSGSLEDDRYSHLKITVWVGLVMGICALLLLPASESFGRHSSWSFMQLLKSAAAYAPASLCYIISMVIGYAGLRYLELSIVSPVQNASGAFSAVCLLIYFISIGRIRDLSEEYSLLNWIGTAVIVIGFLALAVTEQRLASRERQLSNSEKKYRFGALALLFPLLYCLFDTVGTAVDGIILDGGAGQSLGEIDVIVLYGLTFFLAALIAFLILRKKTGKFYQPFSRTELPKALAACCEEFGQVFYVYAMAKKPVLAAPMVASYCIISVLLSRVFLKEKLKTAQYLCVFTVIIGIVILGISDGLAEL